MLLTALLLAACSNPTGPGDADVSIAITRGPTSIAVGQVVEYEALVKDREGRRVADSELTWSSSDPSVAQIVSTHGTTMSMRANRSGRIHIKASTRGASRSLNVRVSDTVDPRALPAFPGAMGFGASALSGYDRQDSEVLFVDNLNSSGEGSLRSAISRSSNSRLSFIIFRTGGTIVLDQQLVLDKSGIYIAGQSAPGDGIEIRASTSLAQTTSSLFHIPRNGRIEDVVIRYVRFRVGEAPNDGPVGVSVMSGNRIIVDHCSIEWASDELLGLVTVAQSGEPLTNVTFQHCIIAQALAATGINIQKTEGDPEMRAYTFYGNLISASMHRMPRVSGGVKQVEFVNNLVYNWGSRAGRTKWDAGTPEVDFVGNYYRRMNLQNDRMLEHEDWAGEGTDQDPSLYVLGNIFDDLQMDPQADQSRLIRYRLSGGTPRNGEPLNASAFRSSPVTGGASDSENVVSASAAYEMVLGEAGVRRRLDCEGNWLTVEDAVDRGVKEDVRRRGGVASRDAVSPEDFGAGGWPSISRGAACEDRDGGTGDGIPDDYERLIDGLDPGNPNDALALSPSGYTWLETYLNGR